MPHSDYLFKHSPAETERLVRQAEMLRPITQRLLTNAGVRSSMHVVDVGCGPGDVTMLAAELVGPRGRVVGIDRNSDIVDIARRRASERGFTNVDFIQGDAENLDKKADFDAAVCRYVLIHQVDPADCFEQ
jgi:ubiquinone/menaquinone biosynthesis C-methylase UbiE